MLLQKLHRHLTDQHRGLMGTLDARFNQGTNETAPKHHALPLLFLGNLRNTSL